MGDLIQFWAVFLAGIFSREIWGILVRYYLLAAVEIERLWEKKAEGVE